MTTTHKSINIKGHSWEGVSGDSLAVIDMQYPYINLSESAEARDARYDQFIADIVAMVADMPGVVSTTTTLTDSVETVL